MDVRESVSKFPFSPGCYVMKDGSGTVLYVGKAKSLRKRVSSYWRATDPKTAALVSEIVEIEYVITDNEVEALLLEMQLIQKYHPKYNIDLQSPGRYAYLKVTDEEYPRLVIARKIEKDKGLYIGPFPSAAARNAILRETYRVFRLCKQKSRIKKTCFRYHLGLCSGACARLISSEEYRASIKQTVKFIKGDFEGVIKETEKKMREASARQQFEKATIYRDQLLALQKLEDQKISRPKQSDQDVINFIEDGSTLTIQLFHFSRGIISGRKEYTFDLSRFNVHTSQAALQEFLTQYYSSHGAPHEIIVPTRLPEEQLTREYLSKTNGRTVAITIPKQGLKLRLLDMVKKNLLSQFGNSGGRLYELKNALRLEVLPTRIVCIDISHLGGTETVGSLVHFINGEPAKSGYRKFIIHSVKGVNDFAAVHEVVSRYGKRVLEEKEKRPDLIIIDGGRGQLNFAKKALDELALQIPSIGLAKRLEEVYVSWSPTPLHLHPKNQALQLLRAIRDEAHRFAVTFQRKRRSKRV